jgi:hypothetical protein
MTHFDRPSRMDGPHGLRAWLLIFSEPLLARSWAQAASIRLRFVATLG